MLKLSEIYHRFFSFSKMDSLMLAAANFESETTVEETFDENLFIKFMKKVVIWDYFAITKAHYLTLPKEEKKDKISRYYSDM